MDRFFAFTDEAGTFGWDFHNQSVGSHFVISAIIVEEKDIVNLRTELESIRKDFFQTGEMKSSSIGINDRRRVAILNRLLQLPFKIFALIVDKRQLITWKGLHYKESFYKYISNILHQELRSNFEKLIITADEYGSSEYMKTFISYVKSKSDYDLFSETDFGFQDSKNDIIIQLADIISGSLYRVYDINRIGIEIPDYKKILRNKITSLIEFPRTPETYIIRNTNFRNDFDTMIKQICLKEVLRFINDNSSNTEMEVRTQKKVLEYLVFEFVNNNCYRYIPTRQLKEQLRFLGIEDISTHTFRTKIIGKLRDKGVIIASSKHGYKIPARESEIYDFVNHGTTIIIPMLERIKKCRDILNSGTNGELDIFDRTEYKKVSDFFK